jgi:beta-xylosidase
MASVSVLPATHEFWTNEVGADGIKSHSLFHSALDATSILSDEATLPGLPNFTGAFVGMACQDLAGASRPADFDFFEYRERSFRANPFSTSAG